MLPVKGKRPELTIVIVLAGVVITIPSSFLFHLLVLNLLSNRPSKGMINFQAFEYCGLVDNTTTS